MSDTHWFRADVDHFLVNEALALGVEYSDETEVSLDAVADSGAAVTATRKGASRRITCRLLVDASGPRGFLHRALRLPESGFDGFPQTQTLFSHFTGVHRTDAMPQFAADHGAALHTAAARDTWPLPPGTSRREWEGSARSPGPTGAVGRDALVAARSAPPYPPNDAALHHVFDDGWMWVLRFGNGVTSAGFSVMDPTAAELNLPDRAGAWQRFLSRFPTIGAQFADAEPIREFAYSPRLAFRAARPPAARGRCCLPQRPSSIPSSAPAYRSR